MDTVNHLVTGFIKVNHSHGKKVSSGTLYSGLKDTAANQGVLAPLPSVGVLGVDNNTELLTPPWGGKQLELWPLPTDESA